MIPRRNILGLLMGAPSAAKVAMETAAQTGIRADGLGTDNRLVTASAARNPFESYEDEEDDEFHRVSPDNLAARIRKLLQLSDKVDSDEDYNRILNGVKRLDPDLASHRSFSIAMKRILQARRDHERVKENSKSWISRELALRKSQATKLGIVF